MLCVSGTILEALHAPTRITITAFLLLPLFAVEETEAQSG